MASLPKNESRARRFLKDQRGGIAIEYGLLALLIAVVIFGAVMAIGQHPLVKPYREISDRLSADDA
ncbi:Flp family type IVb pilin [Limoniibacter endophyticus]|uniref:Pilus assembly protein Flp/PilA n=1 Tax=Limoniibacter endophyticus TaxID=1565040 RepID=A0A8J3DLE3_9HYPH|nr:Flp family type IVb pilin [Limoniibacter endophyticus]GHC80435.1 hypothetical protein GCM10010136_33540 [Limoniibacter endophyticus]